SISADRDITDAGAFDVLFVVASFNVIAHTTKPVVHFIRDASRRGMIICGFETGAYALAAAGVLDGYRATVHWEDLDDFQVRFPRVDVMPDRFLVDRKRCTTGGALPALDFMLDMISREHGLALGITVSGVFIYSHDRSASEPQHVVSTVRLAYRDRQLADAIGLMEKEIGRRLNVQEVAAQVGLSARGLQRRFQTHLSVSPSRFFSDMQMSLAYRLLEHTDRSVTGIALTCGFESGSAFSRAFRSKYKRSPLSLRSRKN
ncbi:MAG TPA: helix-turn-helix domain-containing protein, partial [Planctomycetaceae bacterium]|nr:helix-turn-helix domain-containing protein [Planctomycetaceae bacterium]